MKSGAFEGELSVPVDAVWAELVSPGRRTWYYRLQPQGTFEPGAHISWLDDAGRVGEESEVVELEPARRLVLDTRFVFAPHYASAPAHRVTWELEPAASGTRVRMSFAGEGPAVSLLANEGGAQLKGLRLALDPAAQAEIARLDRIGEVEIRDVTPDRLADYQRFFDEDAFRDYPAWQSCYCMAPLFGGADEEWDARTGAENRAEVSGRIEHGQLTALLAYAGDKPVGWCHYGLSTRLAGIARRYGVAAAHDDAVGALGCFIVAAPYRGHGIAARLLDAALDRLREAGCRSVEAYPPRDRTSPQASYRGPLDMYLRAGFEPYRDEPGKPLIVRRSLV